MATSVFRRAVLPACVIVLPAMALAYLGILAVRDDSERLAAEQERLAALCRRQFDLLVEASLTALRDLPEPRREAVRDRPERYLDHVFVLDLQGRWVAPAISRPHAAEVSDAFAADMARARQVEFAAGDPGRAASLYRDIAAGSPGNSARAMAIHAMARATRKAGHPAAALAAYTDLVEHHPGAVGEAGEPLATYAHLERARLLLDDDQPGKALRALERWLDDINRGAEPVSEGTVFHLERAADLVRAAATAAPPAAVTRLNQRLTETADRIRFAVLHDLDIRQLRLSGWARGPGRREAVVRLVAASGTARLIAMAPTRDSLLAGASLDLVAIQADLRRSVLGDTTGASGFELDLMDDRATVAFRQKHGDSPSLVGSASDRGIPLRLGLHVSDSSALRQQYQRRRHLLLSVVLALAGIVGFAGYLLARDAARERHLSELRGDFVSSVSHELKTPLANIRMYAETLLMGRVRTDQERTECLTAIVQEGQRLDRLVDNVLEFSRLEKGGRTYLLERDDLADVVGLCLELLKYRLEAEGFRVMADLPDRPCPARLDRDAVTQAVLNLLANAMKYSPDEKEIRILVAESEAGPRVEVTDRGVGMSKEDVNRVFEPFYRGEADHLKASGSGLGLAVVRHVMEGHGGRVEVESEPGRGSTFRLAFPPPAGA